MGITKLYFNEKTASESIIMNHGIFLSVLVVVLLPLTSPVFADHVTTHVSIPQGTSIPGCENTNKCFLPYEVTVDVGSTVSWSNDDPGAHTVTSVNDDGVPNNIFDSSLFMAGNTFSHTFKASGEYPYLCMVHPWMTGVIIVQGTSNDIDFKDQDSNDEINFSSLQRGSLVNCETFSYELQINVNSETNVPIIIEIIDPDGNVAGMDEFQSGDIGGNRIIEMNWGQDGRYLIQVKYKGDIYQEDFSYDKMSSETFQNHRNACLNLEYITSTREEISTLFNFLTSPGRDGFWENVRTAEELLRDSNEKNFLDVYSEEALDATLRGKKQVNDLDTLYSTLPEFQALLADLVEAKVISIFQESEDRLTPNPNVTLDEKTELIFELREMKDPTILSQRERAEQYAKSAYMIYQNAHTLQELTSKRIQEDKEIELQTAQEKEAIRQEILSKDVIIPEWIKNNAKWWSEGLIDDYAFTKGIQHLINENVISIPELQPAESSGTIIPEWIKNNAKWWSEGRVSQDEFLNGIKYLVEKGIIQV